MEEVFPSKSLPPAEELQPAPAVPGAVGAEEELGEAWEWWECYRVLAQAHAYTIYMANPPLFLRTKIH